MLHEILLSLSGIPSPIWDLVNNDGPIHDASNASLQAYTSAPEKAMLRVLAELADLHVQIRDTAASTSKSPSAPICRAIASRITTSQLRAFTKKIIQVEASILKEDARYVGAYNIVPLSTIVTEFEPWLRPLRWLRKTIQVLRTHSSPTQQGHRSGKEIFDYFQQEVNTGYTDIRDMTTDLLVAGQQAWMQCLMPWILYGQLPHFGTDDFLIEALDTNDGRDYALRYDAIPYFVTPTAAEAVLAIGKAFSQIKWTISTLQKTSLSGNICNKLMPSSLEKVKSLAYPLQANAFAEAVTSINENIAQTALSHLVPATVVLDFLHLIQDYVLLRNGEFSLLLIKHAQERLEHHSSANNVRPVRKLGRLDNLNINEAEITTILAKTWSELTALASDAGIEDRALERASSWLQLRATRSTMPLNTLLPVNAALTIELPKDSALHVFISASDIRKYRNLSAYLISMHRAELQLVTLWKMTSHRRCYPTHIRPSRSSSRHLIARRTREERRSKKMRSHWACASQVLFLLSEIGNYFHGEVVQKSWDHFSAWLNVDRNASSESSRNASRPTTSSSRRPPTHASENIPESLKRSLASSTMSSMTDPRTIARAHQKYLEALYSSLLLENTALIAVLRELLTTIDHFVALLQRLQTIWQSLDLQEDEGVTDAFSNNAREEEDVMKEMTRTNSNLMDQMHELVSSLTEAERSRDMTNVTAGVARVGLQGSGRSEEFEPWRARTLDQLLMKLDFLAGHEKEDLFEDALVDAEGD